MSRSLSLMFVFVTMAFSPMSPALASCMKIGTVCWDFCTANTVCSSGCTLCSELIEPTPDPGDDDGWCLFQQNLDMDVTLTTVTGVNPYSGWEPGTKYTASLASADNFDIDNYEAFGTGTDYGLGVGSMGLSFELDEADDPNEREIIVTSLYAVVPSFAHSEITPDTTGANRYALEKDTVSGGIVNATTGVVYSLHIRAQMTNSYFSTSDPAKVIIYMTGDMDPPAGTASLSVEAMIYDEDTVVWP